MGRRGYVSSNKNEVIRAALKSLFFIFFFTKRFRMHQKALKAPKSIKSTKSTKSTKKHKNTIKQNHKTQISEQKLKMRLKNI